MTIKQFIEKAIEGGWDDTNYAFGSKQPDEKWKVGAWEYDEKIFLDPKAWQAVGKVEGWKKTRKEWSYREGNSTTIYLLDRAENEMHEMIDVLCAGKTIEEFLKTI